MDIGHSFAVQNSIGLEDPLNSIFKGSIWIGALAVNGFFLISGVLVAGSIERRGVTNYLVALKQHWLCDMQGR